MAGSFKRKRILYVDNSIGYGGSVICLKLFLANMHRDRYYPVVVTSYADQNYEELNKISEWLYIPNKIIEKETIIKGIEKTLEKVKIDGGKSAQIIASSIDYVINLFPYVIKLLVFAKRKKIDLIHLNNEPVANIGGIIVARLLGLSCINHVRGAPLNWDTRTSRWLYKLVDHFITVGEWIKRDVMAFDIPESKISTIWDGRKLNDYEIKSNQAAKRAELGLATGQLSVGIVGRINPWKGHVVFINAAEKVLKRFPDCKFFIIGGSTDKFEDYEKELKHIVASKGLQANMVFTGQRNDVPDIMNAINVMVHTTLAPDPYPGVVIEAMLIGKPIIATNIGGPAEAIENRKTGVLIPPDDPSILAEKICELLSDEKLRLSLGKEAKKVAFERYSIENHVRQIEEVYERVLHEYQKLSDISLKK